MVPLFDYPRWTQTQGWFMTPKRPFPPPPAKKKKLLTKNRVPFLPPMIEGKPPGKRCAAIRLCRKGPGTSASRSTHSPGMGAAIAETLGGTKAQETADEVLRIAKGQPGVRTSVGKMLVGIICMRVYVHQSILSVLAIKDQSHTNMGMCQSRKLDLQSGSNVSCGFP